MIEQQPRWLFIFNSISTTNLRIYITLTVFLMTAVAHLFLGKELSIEWAGLIAAMASVDTVHFASKRFSDARRNNGKAGEYSIESPPSTVDGSTATTDIQELSQTETPKVG